MDSWHTAFNSGSVRCCWCSCPAFPQGHEEDETPRTTKTTQKRPKVIPSLQEGSSRGNNRWTRQVSAWIQKLRPNQPPNTFPDERKPGALNYDFGIGSKTPHRYFDSRLPPTEASPLIKNDIFLLVLYQRKAFLLPKFHPRSLHVIETSALTNSVSARRRNSDPNPFGIDNNYPSGTLQRSSNFGDNLSHIKWHDLREPESQESVKGVKQKIRDRLFWLLSTSKAHISSQRATQETSEPKASSSFLPKFSQKTIEESPQPSPRSRHFALSQLSVDAEEPGSRTRTRSYSSKTTKSSDLQKLVSQSTDSIKADYCSQTSLHKEPPASSAGSLDYCYLSYKKCSEERSDSSTRRAERNQSSSLLPYEQERDDEACGILSSDTDPDVLDHPCEETESRNIVIATWKSFQDNVTNLKCKLRSRYSRERSSSTAKENDEEVSLKEFETEIGTRHKSISGARSSSLGGHSRFKVPPEAKHRAVNASSRRRKTLSFIPSYTTRRSLLKVKKMSRQRPNDDDEEASEEPLPKHLRSMSLPEEPHILHISQPPVRPQRKRFKNKRPLDSESGDDSSRESVESPRIDSRRMLQYSRKEFLENMVSVSSDEDDKKPIPQFESSHFIETVIVKDTPRFSPEFYRTSADEDEDEHIEMSNKNEAFISNSKVSSEEAPSEDTGGLQEVPASKSATLEISRFELNLVGDQTELRANDSSETKCDNKSPSARESSQKVQLPDINKSYFREISTYDVQVNTQDSSSSYICGENLEVNPAIESTDDVPGKTEEGDGYFSGNDDDAHETAATDQDTNISQSPPQGTPTFSRSTSQPHIFVTPAEASDEEVADLEKPRRESIFSFVNAISLPHRSEWSRPAVTAGLVLVNGSSVDSQPETSTIFSSEFGGEPFSSMGERFNVSPNPSSPVPGSSDIHPRTPKSPITVQEWVNSLPSDICDQSEEEPFEHELSAETDKQLQSTKGQPLKKVAREESLDVGDDASKLNSFTRSTTTVVGVSEKEDHTPSSSVPTSSPARAPPLTLNDITRLSFIRDEFSSTGPPTPDKRSQFAETRETQTSFQSDTSYQTASSIESLLESRQLDPVEILLNLGFGSSDNDEGISRIPPRFLKPSKVCGNNINEFMKQEGNLSNFVDSSELVVPNISSQARRRMSLHNISPLVVNLVKEKQQRSRSLQRTSTTSDISSTGSESTRVSCLSRFANVAKGLGAQASFARRLTARLAQRRETIHSCSEERPSSFRNSVLMPENRRFLDLQGQRSPEAPRRLIIGSDSFSLGNNGEILDINEEKEGAAVRAIEDKIEEEEEEGEEEEEEGEQKGGKSERVERSSQHRDSISSVVSSVTSIDSKEEAYLEELHQLTLSVTKGRSGITSTGGKPPHHSHFQDKKKNLLRRLSMSSSKRKLLSAQSSSSIDTWDVDAQIKEEHSHGSSSPSPPTTPMANDEVFSDQTHPPAAQVRRRRSIVRQENVGGEATDARRLSRLPSMQESWSFESGPSIETLKRFPLKRSLAVLPCSTDSEKTTCPAWISEDGSVSDGLDRRSKSAKLQRSSSLPNVFGGEDTPVVSSPRTDEGGEFLKTTSLSLQTSLNTAVLALLQTQICLQNQLKGAPMSPKSTAADAVSSRKTVSPLLANVTQTSTDDKSRSDSTASHEASSLASEMRTALNSVISHLEHYLKDVYPNTPPSSPEIGNIVSQMLWLSQHQNQLCAELEVLSSNGTLLTSSRSTTPSTLPMNAWALTHPYFYRSMPEQINSHFIIPTSAGISSPPSVHSAPFYSTAAPPVFSPLYAPPSLRTASPSHVAALSKQKGGKPHPPLSESSLDGSIDLATMDAAGTGDWNEGKLSGVSSPAFSLSRNNVRSPDSAISEFIAEKISQEVEGTLCSKVTELTQKLDKNSEEVSDIKDKLTMILQCLRPDSKS